MQQVAEMRIGCAGCGEKYQVLLTVYSYRSIIGEQEGMTVKKILYHGSEFVIEKPTYGLGKPYNDYGKGFYCTEDRDIAKEWAVGTGRNGYANCYEMDMDGLDILDLNGDEFSTLHWLAVLIQNRTFDTFSALADEAKEYVIQTFPTPYRTADVIIGYRADDSYFSFAQDFLSGIISLRQLKNAMRLGTLGQQIVLKSRTAFRRIRFLDAELAEAKDWLEKKTKRDKAARSEYLDLERNRRMKGDLYITQILDAEMKPGDPRLR